MSEEFDTSAPASRAIRERLVMLLLEKTPAAEHAQIPERAEQLAAFIDWRQPLAIRPLKQRRTVSPERLEAVRRNAGKRSAATPPSRAPAWPGNGPKHDPPRHRRPGRARDLLGDRRLVPGRRLRRRLNPEPHQRRNFVDGNSRKARRA